MASASGPPVGGSLLDLTVRDLLDAVAADTPAPGGGAGAALGAALAAALTGMAARFSGEPYAAAAEAADTLRRRAAPLADADGAAYRDFLAALRLPRDDDPDGRAAAVRRARDAATDVPLEIGEIAAGVAELAAELAAGGNPNLRGDAVAGALLAAAAAGTAAQLVAANLGAGSADPRLRRARELAAAATAEAGRATGRVAR
jgi:methenyltetrahydrofolate cyclohydrolase